MRVSITAGISLASLSRAYAQSAPTSVTDKLDFLGPDLTLSAAPPEDSGRLALLSSAVGPFYATIDFFPFAKDGDYVSAIGSNGPNGETTTWEAYMPYYFQSIMSGVTTETRETYYTATIGPTTFSATRVIAATSNTRDPNPSRNVFWGAELTTYCSYTSIAPKSPVPFSVWTSLNHATLPPDYWATLSAECTLEGQSSFPTGGASETTDAETFSVRSEARSLWRMVTVLGEYPGATVKSVATETAGAGVAEGTGGGVGGAAQTGLGSGTAAGVTSTSSLAEARPEVTAWVNAVVVVAAAAAMAV